MTERRRFALTLRGDWLFLVLLGIGLLVRVLATVAFRPGLELFADSYDYLYNANHLFHGFYLRLDAFHPIGYAVFLKALWWTRHTLVLVCVQHLLGLLAGAATYFALRRLVTRPWLAAVGAAPVLLDGYQVDIEQFVLSDTLFLVLVLAAALLVLVPKRPGVAACAVAGLLIAAATVTRGLGLALLLPLAVYVVVSRFGWRPVVALSTCALLPVVAYMLRFHQTHGEFALESTDGLWLYGRTAYFAHCAPLPAHERAICPPSPVSHRLSPEVYTWSSYRSPLYLRYQPRQRPAEGKKFAYAVIKAEPLGYLRTTVDSLVRDVAPTRTNIHWAWNVKAWQMSRSIPARTTNTTLAAGTLASSQRASRPFPDHVRAGFGAGFLSTYQKVVWTWGPSLVLAVVVVVVGLVRRRTRRDRRVLVAAVLAATAVLFMIVPALTEVQDYRYLLPVQALLWPAAALAIDALLGDRVESLRRHEA